MAKLFSWYYGRQNTGYKVFTLLDIAWLKLDAHLLLYTQGAYIPPHIDKVPAGTMWRLNIVLWNTGTGGEFCGKSALNIKNRIIILRPSVDVHSVTKKINGTRLVLSFGKIIGKKENKQ